MHGVNKRVHVIPTSLDEDRLEGIFEVRPDYVYILFNGDPIEEHEDLAEDTREAAEDIVKDYVIDEEDDMKSVGINFYEFENALAETYRILYREKLLDNEVHVNLSGGTKPVAVALAMSCSLTNTGSPYYYAAEEYDVEDGVTQSRGMIDQTFALSQLTSLDFSNTIPNEVESQNILRWLYESQEEMGVTELLERYNMFDGSQNEKSRSQVRGPYYGYATQLADKGLLSKDSDGNYEITAAGQLVGRLLTVQKEVEEDVNSDNSQ